MHREIDHSGVYIGPFAQSITTTKNHIDTAGVLSNTLAFTVCLF